MQKLLFMLLVVGISALHATAQQQEMSCCQTPLTATEQFAMLGSDGDFRNSHPNPRNYVYQGQAEQVSYTTPDGGTAQAWLWKAEPASNNYLFVVHEWWGLNDNIKREAAAMAKALGNVNIMALDLYDGKVAMNRQEASSYMQGVKTERAQAIINGAVAHVGANAKIATVGWCFGGGWSLQSAILGGKQTVGCVMYYGMPEKNTDNLKKLNSSVLGIFASKDGWIGPDVVATFQKNMLKAGKELTVHSFSAQHAFANPSNPQFDKAATQVAMQLTINYLKRCFNG